MVKALRQHKLFKPAIGAGMTSMLGLLLWGTPIGDLWVNASYDYLFRFGAHPATNNVVLVAMDSAACRELHQPINQQWDRSVHTRLLNKLADDGCFVVVFDVFFTSEGKEDVDAELATAIRQQGHVVLATKVIEPKYHGSEMAQVLPPIKILLDAAAGTGVGKTDARRGETARRHWPFPASSEGEFISLPWEAASLAGARLSQTPQKQWLRYYGETGPWATFSYNYALLKARGYFRNKIVFIGKTPQTPVPGDEEDEFSTPYTRWTGSSSAGVEIMATEFLNLMNADWLRRPTWWVELLVLVTTGMILGGGMCRVSALGACAVGIGTALGVTLGGVSLSHITNYWFPWLVIAGGQVPCALAWALVGAKVTQPKIETIETVEVQPPTPQPEPALVEAGKTELPDAPDYELFNRPFGEGAYGKVWLARNAIGQWQALKAVYMAKFAENAHGYEREFNGIMNYKPVSDKHPGLLRVDFVSKKKPAGYFYYVMELADAMKPGWEENPSTYVPCDLAKVRAAAEGRRLPINDCVRLGAELAAALDFLHRQGLTHRDVKPQNIIYVKGRPKLADVGLVAEVLPPGAERTWVGTHGYMPPPPEPPGSPSADIYGLGMVLYVIFTGGLPRYFPELATTLLANPRGLRRLNEIIMKACEPDLSRRYSSAAEMAAELTELQKTFQGEAITGFPSG